MAITEQRIVTGTCDLCGTEINTTDPYLNAMVYGATFHEGCWTTMAWTPAEICKALGLDDIRWANGPNDGDKAIYV